MNVLIMYLGLKLMPLVCLMLNGGIWTNIFETNDTCVLKYLMAHNNVGAIIINAVIKLGIMACL